MASKQTYECYICKRNNFPNVRVYLDGKTEDGKTIYKNEDMSPHQHKQKQQQQQQQSGRINPTEQAQTEYDKPVDRGINAFSMMRDLIRLVEQIQKQIVTIDEKVDRLTK